MCSVGSDGKKSHRVLLHFGLRCALAAMIAGAGAAHAPAQCMEQQKLTASDPFEFNGFGTSVSVSGIRAIVGAGTGTCWPGPPCGSASVFRFNGTSWEEEQKLTLSVSVFNERFGDSVSLRAYPRNSPDA